MAGPSGSSPHTRGAHVVVSLMKIGERIIPAYAGSTRRRSPTPSTPTDHPRIRGEHRMQVFTSRGVQGSSPHTRGARLRSTRWASTSRIIPAYAGSTPPDPRSRPGSADHPRIRGEHLARDVEVADESGSSPHTRGALLKKTRHAPAERIIPAYAGSTVKLSYL